MIVDPCEALAAWKSLAFFHRIASTIDSKIKKSRAKGKGSYTKSEPPMLYNPSASGSASGPVDRPARTHL